MNKLVTIGGKTYKLVPVEESLVEAYGGIVQKEEYSPVEGEIAGSNPVAPAVPKVSDYRERFKERKIRMNEVTAKTNYTKELPKQDRQLDSTGLFFGEGLEIDL